MTRRKSAVVIAIALCAVGVVATGPVQAVVVTIYPGTKITPVGVEPAEWQLSHGWSIVTNKMGVGKITAGGPSVCETPYEPFKAYNLYNADGALFPRWQITQPPTVKQDFGRGAFYASCDSSYGLGGSSGVTGSSVWLGTDQHGGRSLAGVKLSQITKMKYYALVSGIPTWLTPGTADANWDSWKNAWRNPRFPIMLTFTIEGPLGRKQLWFRPWGQHSTIGDDASDGRLSVWEQYDCMQPVGASTSGSGGMWFLTGGARDASVEPDREYDCPGQYNSWSEVLNGTAALPALRDYTLVATSTSYNRAAGQWKSPGYTDYPEAEITDPPGLPACTGTGKCLNFWVGARFIRLLRPDECSYKTWYPESRGFRGQMDWFEFAVNYGTAQNPDIVDVTYNFEPAPDDPGPRFVYTTQDAINQAKNLDTLIELRGQPEDKYDPAANPLKDNAEERLYDVLFKISGKVVEKYNAYSVLDDGANLPLKTRVYMMLQDRWLTPSNPMAAGQHWSSWGLLERFKPTGSPPYVDKPYIVWTSKTHNRKMQ